ncbi:DUF7695 domain-containing protein [Pontibacterium sinense]|uniref:DUF7695 domain-containing protein n=1 Tax=Pontibacterium sinense TaxID=2781979 RepID=UPI003FCE1D9F
MEIKRNRAKCRKCGEIIESKHEHEFVTCHCGSISVDGGQTHLSRTGQVKNVIELSEVVRS